LNVTGQQSLVLAGEYLPADRRAQDPSSGNPLALPSGGAILKRLTVVRSGPDDSLTVLHADYSAPHTSARTYESLATNARSASSREQADVNVPRDSSSLLAPAAKYAEGQRSGGGVSRKGNVIDVYA
jgi:hypothetical protein